MYNSIKSIHLELTDRCNAACPQCPRTNPKTGTAYDWIIKTELTLSDIKTMLPVEVLRNLDKIVIGGNYGEPILATDFFKIMEYFLEHSDCLIFVQTNGSLRNIEWWKEYGKLVAGKQVRTIFGIDGANQEDHEIYRRNTSRNKILNNAQAYIDAGGFAIAQMLVYEHNEWSAQEVSKIYEEMGFAKTTHVITERFYGNNNFKYNYKGQEYELIRTTTEEDYKKFYWLEGSRNDQEEIFCFAKLDQHIYIDCLGYVTPCCFLGMYPYMIAAKSTETNLESYQDEIEEALHIFRQINLEEIRGKNILDIIKHPVYQQISDMHKSHLPKKCQRVCGGDKFRNIWFNTK